MSIDIILKLISLGIGAILTFIPMLIKVINTGKKLKNAKTNSEKEAAKNELRQEAINLCAAAEIAYKEINEALKAKGSSAGSIKKDSVMTKLENFAIENGKYFDKEYWNNEIDKIVSDSKLINYN